jgi:hypothetical protein
MKKYCGMLEERILVKTIMMRRKNWIGHILRNEGLVKDVLESVWRGKGQEDGSV